MQSSEAISFVHSPGSSGCLGVNRPSEIGLILPVTHCLVAI